MKSVSDQPRQREHKAPREERKGRAGARHHDDVARQLRVAAHLLRHRERGDGGGGGEHGDERRQIGAPEAQRHGGGQRGGGNDHQTPQRDGDKLPPVLPRVPKVEERAQQEQQLNEEQEDFNYPELKDNWALVIGASDTWDNYRHQADALAIYQMLKRHGYDDDHIILILADNIANDHQNIYPGEVYVRPKGTEGAENVYKDVVVDYRLSDVGIGDLRKILLGERSEKYPIVMDCTEHSNIFIYWCGHGNRGKVAWGSNLQLTTETMSEGWKQITDAKKYRKIFAAIDACYSGSIGEAIVGLPGVLYLTAANANEPSKADMLDPDMQIWLSNGFTRAFEQVLWRDPSIKLRDLYQYVARLTTGSHASIYNEAHYGNLFHNSIAEFLPDQVASGIREVQSEGAKNGKWHDLQGRQILQPGKGIYIRDGKKIVIK